MDKLKILVVDDEKSILELLTINLRILGYEVISASTGMEAILQASLESPSLILLDVMLPDGDGVGICSMIRNNEKTKYIPIILLSAKSQEEDKIKGLMAGADDYITKPFSIKEVDARIQSVLRRSINHWENQDSKNDYIKNSLSINREKFEVLKGNDPIDLTLTEFRILSKLYENPNKVYTREDLMEEVSLDKGKGDLRTIDVHIRNIRKKIESDNEEYIETVRGIGYRVK